MEKQRKLELIQRSLGLRHKLKVLDSMKAPDTHEDIAVAMVAKWELEDELRAIEDLLADVRAKQVAQQRAELERTLGDGTHAPVKKKSSKK